MPVDKFGRMSDIKTKDTGVSLTYINNNYVRSDGDTLLSGSLDMRGNTIYNVADPVNPQDVATKEYADTTNKAFVLYEGKYLSVGDLSLGMFKDEAAGKRIKEFVGLRAKLYSFIMEDGKENKRCKGVKKQVVESSITHEDYKTCLRTGKEQLRKQNILRSYEHEVYTEEINKIALSALDDKRYILGDGIHTLAWGHHKIKNN